MKKTLLVLFFLISGCKSLEVAIYFEEIPEELLSNENRYDLDNIIYPLDKKIAFSFKMLKNGMKQESEIEKIEMTIQGTTKPFSNFDSGYKQTVIKYEYFDADNNRIHLERTGLVENTKNIWIHPPRMGEAGILQLSAFPFIRFDKKQWVWKLDAGYQNYQDVHLIHNYKKLEPVVYDTEYGALKCIPIHVSTKSHLGETSSKFLFNEKLGFVKLEFNNINNSTIILTLNK